MITEVINKLIITAEAVFDYTETLGLGMLDKRGLKAEGEEYIDIKNRNGRLLYENYFRCKYLDEGSGRMLMLFLYRADKIGIMQNWLVRGVCFAEDWSEEAEDDGLIRLWVESSITEFKKGDWVVQQQVNAEADKITLGFAVRGSIEGLPKEVKYAIEYGNDNEFAEAVSLLQNAGGKWAWRNIVKRKDDLPRKLGKRPKRG
jgi:hypothetical protein